MQSAEINNCVFLLQVLIFSQNIISPEVTLTNAFFINSMFVSGIKLIDLVDFLRPWANQLKETKKGFSIYLQLATETKKASR
jgi:hypothetical protein